MEERRGRDRYQALPICRAAYRVVVVKSVSTKQPRRGDEQHFPLWQERNAASGLSALQGSVAFVTTLARRRILSSVSSRSIYQLHEPLPVGDIPLHEKRSEPSSQWDLERRPMCEFEQAERSRHS